MTTPESKKIDNYAKRLEKIGQQAPKVSDHLCQELSDMLSHGIFLLLKSYQSIKEKNKSNKGD